MTPNATPNRPRARRPGARARPPAPSRTGRLLLAGLAVVVVVALAVALAAGRGGGNGGSSGTSDGGSRAASPVVVTGQALPQLPDQGPDPAVGARMPTLRGTDPQGRPVTVGAPGQPQMILFLAHWCPHCQAEVPVVQDWVDNGGLPAGLRLESVATANDPRRPNYPASAWLAREGWTAPVLLDDADSHAGTAAALPAFPYFVMVDGQGQVVARATGELTTAQLTDAANTLMATAG